MRSRIIHLAPAFVAVLASVASPANAQMRAEPAVSRSAAAGTIEVYIMGEIDKPGKIEVKPGTTILQFLAEAGGVTRSAAKARIELHRSQPRQGAVVYLFSANGRGQGPRIASNTPLAPGDVVVVPARYLFE